MFLRLIFAGDSSGANIAAALALYWRDHYNGLDLSSIRAQVLIYPPLQAMNLNTPSYQQNARKGLVLSQQTMAEYWAYYAQGSKTDVGHYLLHQHVHSITAKRYRVALNVNNLPKEFYSQNYKEVLYVRTDEELALQLEPIITNPRFAPLMASSFEGLPPTYILSCFYDVLRDDGVLYAELLSNAGVSVYHKQAKAGYHGIFWRLYLDDGLAVYENAVNYIKKHIL